MVFWHSDASTWFLPLALGSLVCGAFSDIVFKLYARRGGDIGWSIAVSGLVWMAVFGMAARGSDTAWAGGATWFWGVVSGGLGAVANVLLVESMRRSDVGTCATVYRMNLVPAAILAMVFLGEPVRLVTVAGILLATGVVLSMWERPAAVLGSPGGISGAGAVNLPWLVVLACFLRAGMGVSYKAGMNQGAGAWMLLAINGGMWTVCGLSWSVIRAKLRWDSSGPARGQGPGYWLPLLSGVLTCGVVGFLVMALERGAASIVLPISQLSFVLTAAIGVVFLKEMLTARKAVGIGLASVCVLMMAVLA